MPQRFELTELSTGTIGGLPFAVAYARGKRMVGFVATIDGDGLLETGDDCRRAAARFLERLDVHEKRRKDETA
jgi:hypothetical protein